MRTYQTWSIDVPMEYIEASSGWEARKLFAAKHKLPVTECMARWVNSSPAQSASA